MIKKTMFITAFAALAMFGTSQMAHAGDLPTLKVCTGAKGGIYEYFGATLQKQLRDSIDVQLIPSTGSWDNLQKIASGACDAGLSQSDNLYAFSKESVDALNIQVMDGNLYTEYFTMICNRGSGVGSFADLNGKTPVYTGGRGSGSDVSLRTLIQVKADAGYKELKNVPLDNEQSLAALIKLNGGQGSCLAYVGAPGGQFMRNAQKFSENLVIVPVDDKSFSSLAYKDKKGISTPVWNTDAKITSDAYGKLMPDGKLWGKKDVPTVGISATFLVSNAWTETNPESFGNLGLTLPDVKNIVRSNKGLQ